MIYTLKGLVQELTPTYVVVDVNGVGYYAGISLQTSEKLTLGQPTLLFIQQIIREDAHLLFAFNTSLEKELFNLLISVNGVGPVSALIMLSSLTNEEIGSAIVSGQAGLLQKVKGIGIKTAERIIVDLKDKVQKLGLNDEKKLTPIYNKTQEEALSALEVLGISRKISEKFSAKILIQNPEIKVEELVKQILKNL